MAGDLDNIPADIFIRHYGSLRRIAKDHAVPDRREGVEVRVYWGVSGSGKSHRAFEEAFADVDKSSVYLKSSSNKWWDGYRGQSRVIIDEFRGQIGIEHLLRWFDKYATSVEIKGDAAPLAATQFWVTSNLNPDEWYPTLDVLTKAALRRRLTLVVHYEFPYGHHPAMPLDQ